MNPATFLQTAIVPALALLPGIPDTPGARVQLLATAIQESGLKAAVQIPSGAARSFLQMEKNGAVLNVLTNDRAMPMLHSAIGALLYPGGMPAGWTIGLDELFIAIAWSDVLACVIARLQYWLSPLRMPDVGDRVGALHMYCQTWEPAWYLDALKGGKTPAQAMADEPGRWPASHAVAVAAVTA